MKRLRRWLYIGLLILSVYLAVATTAAWCGSFFAMFHEVIVLPIWIGEHQRFLIYTDRSSLSFCHVTLIDEGLTDQEYIGLWHNPSRWLHDNHFWGFRYVYGDQALWYGIDGPRDIQRWFGLGIPNAIAIPLFLIPPLRRLSNVLWRKRCKRFGLCINCGYDLRGTHDHCPECGKIPINIETIST
jgi:hypothetical protein